MVSIVEQYAVRATDAATWRVLEALAALEAGTGLGGAALRGAAGFGTGQAKAQRFQATMVVAREMHLVRFRRPAFRGELGESPTAHSPWIYQITELALALLEARKSMQKPAEERKQATNDAVRC